MDSQNSNVAGKKSWVKRHPVLTGIGIFIVLIIIIGSIGGDDTGSVAENTNSTSEQQEPTPIAMKVDPNTLRTAYKTNQVSADQQYEGKLVEMTGVIDTIGKDILDEAYVTFQTDEQYALDKVQCMFNAKNEAQLVTFVPGQTITVQGTVSGVVILGPLVRDCKVVAS